VTVPATSALEPLTKNLKVTRDASYEAQFELWEDEAHTKPLDLVGWTVTLTPNGLPPITTGAISEDLIIPFEIGEGNITIPSNGVVAVTLTPEKTLTYPVGKYHYVLWVEKEQEPGKLTRLPPVVGVLQVANA
jgi:hypothetical protein